LQFFVSQTTSLNPAFSPRRRRNVRRVFGILNDGIGRTVAGKTGTRKSGSFSWGRRSGWGRATNKNLNCETRAKSAGIMSQCAAKKVIAKLRRRVQNLQCQIDEISVTLKELEP